MHVRIRCQALVALLLGSVVYAADDDVDFSRDVLPLLSNNCFQCHGPDEGQRQAGLRFDLREPALAELESGAKAIVPGDRKASELFARLTTHDADLQMPPADSGKSLTTAQVELIGKWIDSGAEYTKHWAFEPPKKSTVPAATKGWRSNNAVDRFIHAKLARKDLSPESRASKETLIRRLSLDLTGLPPAIADVDAFLADDSDDAYEKVVDRLLASPEYGEHMARIWLDAARYGDTHGLHLDNERSLWPYRDWVIESFNKNQPFDEFTIEQIAGDLLPKPTLQQKVATGFNRCNVTTGEGGSINEEYFVRYAVDRVETTATVWLGLTAGCAACHDHKFDPLTQKEFYQLFSYYFSLTEKAMDGNVLLPPPSIKVPSPEQTARKEQYNRDIAAANKEIERLLSEFKYTDPRQNEPLGELTSQELVWIDDALPTGAVPQGNGPNPWKFVGGKQHPVHQGRKSHTRVGQKGAITQHFFTGATDKLRVDANSKLFAYVFIDPKNPPQTIQLQFNDGTWDHRATWGEDKAFLAGQRGPKNHQMGPLPKTGEWVRLEVEATKVGLAPGRELNGWAFTQVGGTLHWDTAGIVAKSISDQQRRSLYSWEQFRKTVKQPALPKDVQAVLNLDRTKRNDAQIQKLTRYYLQHVHPDSKATLEKPLQRQAKLRDQIAALEKAIPATMIMAERKTPRQAHVLERGEYNLKREPVNSSVPTWLAPPVAGTPQNRLGLAKWLVQPQHPLTARVTVNRFWQQFFGIGLVRTAEDFGVQGEQPTHPELIDWLAIDFIESGWNVKRFVKQILMSATYQQSSRVDRSKLAIDPENRLLARGPRFRLDAEVIRDQALAVSGLLVEQIGGRSVKPYQPAGLWKPVGFGGSNTSVFVRDNGQKLYRRSMYTFWKRTMPPPSMSTFDAPNRETCEVRRARTNTPLQALVLMNDVQFVEAARTFAERVLKEGGTTNDERITFAFRSAVAREPTATEIATITALLNESVAEFLKEPEAAKLLLASGESPRDESLDANELAAWTMVTHLVLNLSEIVTKN